MKSGELFRQPGAGPTRKVAAAALVGTPLATVLVWLLGTFNIDVPPEVAASLAALLAAVVAWFTRERWLPPETVRGGKKQ